MRRSEPSPDEAGDPGCGHRVVIGVGDDAAHQQRHIVQPGFIEQLANTRNERQMRAAEDAEAHQRHILLKRGFGDHFRSLAQTGVDDFVTGIAQGAGDNLRSAIMPIEARFGN